MKVINQLDMTFEALSVNESFARSSVAAFCSQSNPTLDEITDIKTAVSEAVTNAIVHAYPRKQGKVRLRVNLFSDGVVIEIQDYGVGIPDINKAREPFFTTKANEERSGMGFTVMESFMDSINVVSNKGVCVSMYKKFQVDNKVAMGE